MSAAPKSSPPEFSPGEPPSAAQRTAAASLEAMVASKMDRRARPRSFRASKPQIERAREGMERMTASGDWSEAVGAHLVALYEWLFLQVYGVATAELDPKNRAIASAMAGRFVHEHFADDYGAAVMFMKWTWKREQGREQWARENGKERGRVGWRLQWSGSIVTDYRVDCARRSR